MVLRQLLDPPQASSCTKDRSDPHLPAPALRTFEPGAYRVHPALPAAPMAELHKREGVEDYDPAASPALDLQAVSVPVVVSQLVEPLASHSSPAASVPVILPAHLFALRSIDPID